MATQTFNKPAKLKITVDILNEGSAGIGKVFYCLTNNRIYIKLDSGMIKSGTLT